jgi:uncharacterized membrane protein YdjX (TVP38/TMEM64 family)
MNRFWLATSVVALIILACFGLAMWWGHPMFTDPVPYLGNAGPGAMILSCLLLASDVLLPVPSSIIMIANGTMFGLGMGTMASMLGGLMAVFVGWGLGRWGSERIKRWTGSASMEQAKKFMDRWGYLAILLSRPIPVLAETIVIMAGSLRMSPWRVGLYSAAGLIAPSILYAYAGSEAADAPQAWQSFMWVVGIAVLAWIAARIFQQKVQP